MNNNELETAYNERFLVQKEYLGTNKAINNITPLVSITVATYQHVGYIAECLESLITQKTSFPYEIIIGDDGSTDGTTDICKTYADKYPDKIRLFIRDRKLSQYINSEGTIVRFNGLWNRMSTRGKYIAWCDGDDYWIDPLKLQKQITFLETHPDYGLMYTLSQVYDQNKKQIKEKTVGWDYKGYNNLLAYNCIPTVTTCMRKDAIIKYTNDIKPQLRNWLMGDYPMWLWIAYNYKIKFLPEVTSVYRVLEKSASHFQDINSKEKFFLSTIDITTFYIQKYNLTPTDIYKQSLNEYYYALYNIYIQMANYKKSKHYAQLIDFNHATSHMRKEVRKFYIRYLKFLLKKSFANKKTFSLHI